MSKSRPCSIHGEKGLSISAAPDSDRSRKIDNHVQYFPGSSMSNMLTYIDLDAAPHPALHPPALPSAVATDQVYL